MPGGKSRKIQGLVIRRILWYNDLVNEKKGGLEGYAEGACEGDGGSAAGRTGTGQILGGIPRHFGKRVCAAVEEAIRRENRDYDLPTLETARLAQLVDAIGAMSANLRNLEHIVVDGFDQFVRLTRGENYLDLHDSVYDDEDDAEEG